MPGQHTEHAFETAIEHHLITTGGSAADYRLLPFSVNIPPARIAYTSKGGDAGSVCVQNPAEN